MLDAFENIRSSHPDDDAPSKSVMPLVSIPREARKTMEDFCITAFNKTYAAALDQGLVTKQGITILVGKDVVKSLDSKKSNPSPVHCRLILQHIAACDPEKATGRKEKWRHANPRPREEYSPQPL